MEFLYWILVAFVGAYVLVFEVLRRINEWYYVSRLGKGYNLPPGDMGWPLIGILLPFLKAFRSGQPDSFIDNLVSKYGTIGLYKTFLFGSPSIIVTTPEACRHVLMNDEQYMFGYTKATRLLIGKRSLSVVPKPEHRRIRRLTASMISGHEALSLYIGHIEDIVIHSLDEWASMKKPIEFLTEMKTVAFKVLMHIFVGSSTDSYIGKTEKLYTDFHHGFKSTPINIPGTTFSRALEAREELKRIFMSLLNDKRARILKGNEDPKRKKDMTDLLSVARDDEGQGLDDECIIDLLIGFFFAGHETSAYTTMRAIILLSEHPDVLAKAKEEQQRVVNERPPEQTGLTMKEIRQMGYLSKVIEETLRVTSLAFTLSRETRADVNLNGYTIPKGWKMLVWTRAIHMNPEIYPNPLEFNPSRWDTQRTRAGTFMPFGAGMRLCPGLDLSKLEVAVFLHYFLLHYKFERVNPKCPETYLPLPKPIDNCLARMTRDIES